MTPKDKANELFDKYYIICQEYTEEIQCSIQAQQCALIAVDELIDFAKLTDATNGWDHLNYWQEIKQEIEKL